MPMWRWSGCCETPQTLDRGLVTELTGAIRHRRTLDAWLDRLGKVPAAKQPPKLRWLLRGLYRCC